MSVDTSKVTRIDVISDKHGVEQVWLGINVKNMMLQDDGRTLKIWLTHPEGLRAQVIREIKEAWMRDGIAHS